MQVPAFRTHDGSQRLIMPKADSGPDITVVIAAHNEAENIAPMCAVLKQLLAPLGRYEIIFVEDGSTDGTLEAIRAAARDPVVRYVSLTRNFGHEACLPPGPGAVPARGGALVRVFTHHHSVPPGRAQAWGDQVFAAALGGTGRDRHCLAQYPAAAGRYLAVTELRRGRWPAHRLFDREFPV